MNSPYYVMAFLKAQSPIVYVEEWEVFQEISPLSVRFKFLPDPLQYMLSKNP